MKGEAVTIHNMSRGRTVWMMIAVILSAMCTMGDFVITPIASDLYEVFAGEPEALINFGITGPAIVAIPMGIIAGILADRIDKRTFMIVGFAIFTVSSVLGGLIDNIYYFVTMRVFATGVGYGITNVCAFAILAEVFTDEKQHGTMVGYYTTGVNIIGIPLSLLAGFLAVATGVWTGVFYTYLFAIPVLILLIVFLPKCPPRSKAAQAQEAAEIAESAASQAPQKARAGWWKRMLLLAIQVAIFATCYYVTWYMISLYVADANLGDETFSALLSSLINVGGIVSAAVFGAIYGKMRNAVYLPFMLIVGVGVFIMAFFPNAMLAAVMVTVMGFSWTQYYCYVYTRCTEIVPEDKIGTSTGVMGACISVGTFLCSYFITGLASAAGSASVIPVWWIPGAIIVVLFVVSLVFFLANRKKDAAQA